MRPARKFKRPTSRFRKLITGMAVILVVVLAAALILPGYIDWNRFKNEIEQQASAVISRQVRIDGAISFSLLPRPALSIEKASIANSQGALEPVMLGMERLEAQLSVLPLFSGKIQVANFRLIAPVLNLETLPDGSNNWVWRTTAPQTRAPGIRLDQVIIERGVLRYRNRVSGEDIRLTQMDIQLTAGSLQGPFDANGSVRLQEQPVGFAVTLGVITPGRATPVKLKTRLAGNAGVDFSGNISPDGQPGGLLVSQGTDLTGLVASLQQFGAPVLSGVPPALLQHAFRVEGNLVTTPENIKFEKIKFRLGGNILTGNLSLDMRETPRFEFIVRASGLDMDALFTPVSPIVTGPGVTAPGNFVIPGNISGVVRMSANTVQLRNGAVRDVKLAVSVADGIATLDQLDAQLPGSTAMRISGKVMAGQGQPHFTGKLDLKAENLRGLLGWLGIDVPDMPGRSLSRGEVSAQLDLSSTLAELHAMRAVVDSSTITGDLALALRDRPALGIDLHIDHWNADGYLPEENDLMANIPPADTTPAAAASVISWPMLRDLANTYDSNFKLSIDAVTYRGVPVSGVLADGALIGGTLAVNSFAIADMAKTALSVSGVVSNFAAEAQGEINLRLASNDLSGLARTVGVMLPIPGGQLGKSSVEAKFLLANSAVEAVIDSRFGDTTVLVNGGVNGFAPGGNARPASPISYRAQISLANPSLAKFAVQSGLAIYPNAAEDAAGIALTAELVSADGEISLNAVNGAIGAIPVQGQASWRTGGARPLLRAEFSAGEVFADNFSQEQRQSGAPVSSPTRQLPWSGAPLDLALLEMFEAEIKLRAARFSYNGYDFITPAVQLALHDGLASLKQFSGTLFGGEFSAAATLRGATVPELDASWNLQGADLEAASAAMMGRPVITGRLDFSGQVKGTGASGFALISSLEGQAKAMASNGVLRGIDLPALGAGLARLERAADFSGLLETVLRDGKTPYQRIGALFIIRQGVAESKEPVISIDSVTAGLNASVDFPRYWIDAEASLTMNAHMSAPPLGFAYIGPLNNPASTLLTHRLENYFTQALLSKSLQRVINNRDMPVAPAAAAPQASPAAVPAPVTAPAQKKDNSAKKILNDIFDGIIGEKTQ